MLPHTGRTERGPAYQAFEPAGQVLPAGRAVHPAPPVYLRVRRRFDRLGRPAVGRDYDTTSLPSSPAPGTPFPASQAGRPPHGSAPFAALPALGRCRRRVGHRCICRGEPPPAPRAWSPRQRLVALCGRPEQFSYPLPGRSHRQRNGQPAPTAGQIAKFRKASTKRLAQAGGTMFCREFG